MKDKNIEMENALAECPPRTHLTLSNMYTSVRSFFTGIYSRFQRTLFSLENAVVPSKIKNDAEVTREHEEYAQALYVPFDFENPAESDNELYENRPVESLSRSSSYDQSFDYDSEDDESIVEDSSENGSELDSYSTLDEASMSSSDDWSDSQSESFDSEEDDEMPSDVETLGAVEAVEDVEDVEAVKDVEDVEAVEAVDEHYSSAYGGVAIKRKIELIDDESVPKRSKD